MLNLLKYQFRKLFKSITFYCLLGFIFVGTLIDVFTFFGAGAYFVDYLTHFNAMSFMLFGLSVFVPVFVCDDYTSGAVKTV